MKYFFYTYLFITIFFTANISGQEKIIKQGDVWKYYDTGIPASNWTSLVFSDKEWKEGISPLGYGDKLIKTELNYGLDPDHKDLVKFFRKKIVLKSPFDYLMYELKVQRDDGIVIYVNGREIERDNMPEGKIDYQKTTAISLIHNTKNESFFHSFFLTPDVFAEGTNVIAVSVHQATRASSDCIFNLELIGHNEASVLPLVLREKSIKNLKIESNLKELNAKLLVEKKDLEINFLKNLLYTLLLIALVGLGILIYRIYVLKKQKQKSKHKIKKLKKVNEIKDKELMNNSLKLVHNQNLFEDIKNNLEESLTLDEGLLKKSVKKRIQNIDHNIDQNEEWIRLLGYFNSVHKGFVEFLKREYNTLTDLELRHCVFIKLQMQTKEIANILHVNPRSVQATRYRIKKKMDLPEEVDLRDYLLSINTNA
ncbi:helix-turn-helix transcriptional regulator [Tenacibaculum sp. UWU-22]|uniref:helix-turn-helix transcriptional regulator n=1 Tax=Tenacibaculum sp. UWU-22 TaxID=3234187 RepID=UPI0034DB11B6